MTAIAVVLAAGAGSRFHGEHHKLMTLIETDGGLRPLVHHAIEHALAGEVGPVVVIGGAVELDLPASITDRVTLIVNADWAAGQSTSIACAVREAERLGVDHVLIGLGDQPGVRPEDWSAVGSAPSEWPIVVASYDGRRGPHPVRLHRSLWPLLPTAGDDGARRIMRDHPDLVHDVACTGSATDIDTLEDVQRWKSS
jgi:molybdenum cofactor cytidylyltransferase